MKKSLLKKVVAFVLAIAMVVTGLYIVGPEAKEVQAEETDIISREYSTTAVRNYWGKAPADVPEGKIFAGWYEDEACTKKIEHYEEEYVAGGKSYAKFVDKDILTLKMQLSADSTQLRLVSSVDSLDYSLVGFEVSFDNEAPFEWSTSTVMNRIKAVNTNVEYEYSPKVVDGDSEYFVTGTLTGINPLKKDKEFYVRPYVVTLDGAKSYGVGRMFSVADGEAQNYFNVAIESEEVTAGDTVQVSVDGTNVNAEVVGWKHGYAHLNVQKAKSELASNVKVTYGGNTTIHENLKSKETEDTSWYDATQDTYYLATAADLMGFNKLANSGTSFQNKTVILTRNVTIPEETAWIPLFFGQDWLNTDLVFDGNGNTISGVNVNVNNGPGGFFAILNDDGVVKNLKISDSSIVVDGSCVGTIVGRCYGQVQGVHVDSTVTVTTPYQHLGGIVGALCASGRVESCWFAGNAKASGNGQNGAGGIVGTIEGANNLINNCLMTGTIEGSGWGTGGINGYVNGGKTFKIKNSLFAGTIKNDKSRWSGLINGAAEGTTSSLYLQDVYAINGATTNPNPDNGNMFIGMNYQGTALNWYGQAKEVTTEQIVGNAAYENLGFDFWSENNEDGAWVITETGTPQLRSWTTYNEKELMQGYTGENGPIKHTGWYDVKTMQNGEFADPNGKADVVFEIETAADLYYLQEKSQSYDFWKNTIQFMQDIDLNPGLDLTKEEDRSSAQQWLPIGKKTDGTVLAFMGCINGGGYELSGMYIEGVSDYNGFVALANGGSGYLDIIKNLSFANAYLDAKGYEFSGVTAGQANQTTVKSVYVEQDVVISSGDGDYTGGIVGLTSYSKIKNSGFAGVINTIESSYSNGGIVGRVISTQDDKVALENCIFAGVINAGDYRIGGLVGEGNATMTIKDCVSNGIINATYGSGIGEVIGHVSYHVTIQNVYASTELRKGGSIIADSVKIDSGCTLNGEKTTLTDEQIKGANAIKNMSTLDFGENGVWVATVDGPQLKAFADPTTVVHETTYMDWYTPDDADGIYEIGTAAELYYFLELANNETDFSNKTIKLTDDIDLNEGFDATKATVSSPAIKWDGVESFDAIFDGNYKTISGVYYVGSEDRGGMFRNVGTNGRINNLKIANSYYADTASGWWYGSLVGDLKGQIENIHVGKDVVITNKNLGTGEFFGGVVGVVSASDATIKKCFFEGTVDAVAYPSGILGRADANVVIENCYNNGILKGKHVAGILGRIKGESTSATVNSCVNTGTLVTSDTYAGSIWCSNDGTVVPTKNYAVLSMVDEEGVTMSDRNSDQEGVTTYDTVDSLKEKVQTIITELGAAWAIDNTTGLPMLKFEPEQ